MYSYFLCRMFNKFELLLNRGLNSWLTYSLLEHNFHQTIVFKKIHIAEKIVTISFIKFICFNIVAP